MPFKSFSLGQQMGFPGEFLRIVNNGLPPAVSTAGGIVACLIAADQGPVNVPTAIEDELTLAATFGTGGGTQVPLKALRAGAPEVLVTRVGSGGTVASFSLTLADGTTAAVTIPVANPGVTANTYSVTVRDNLLDTTKRELVLYQGLTQLLLVPFAKAPTTTGGHGEAGALVAAVNAVASPYLGTAVLVGTPGDTTTLHAQTNMAPGTPGVDPTVANSAYTTAMTQLQAQAWDILVTDSVDQSLGASAASFVTNQRNNGHFQLLVLGEPTSVIRTTRQTDATAYNSPWVIYVGNGYTDADGNEQGANAAGTVAGMIAGSDYNANLTSAVVPNALPGQKNLLDPLLTSVDLAAVIASGMLVFDTNVAGQPRISYAISTFVAPDSTHHAGWRFISVVRTYDHLMASIGAALDQMTNLHNNSAGRSTVVQAMQRVLNQMVAEGSLQSDGNAQAIEDPSNPPSGDSAHFIITANVVYGLSKIYVLGQFAFSGTTAA